MLFLHYYIYSYSIQFTHVYSIINFRVRFYWNCENTNWISLDGRVQVLDLLSESLSLLMQLSSLLLHLTDVFSRLLQRGGFTDLRQQKWGLSHVSIPHNSAHILSMTVVVLRNIGCSAAFTFHTVINPASPQLFLYLLHHCVSLYCTFMLGWELSVVTSLCKVSKPSLMLNRRFCSAEMWVILLVSICCRCKRHNDTASAFLQKLNACMLN